MHQKALRRANNPKSEGSRALEAFLGRTLMQYLVSICARLGGLGVLRVEKAQSTRLLEAYKKCSALGFDSSEHARNEKAFASSQAQQCVS